MRCEVGRVHYHVKTAGSGPPVLLLHGFMGSLDMWKPWWEDWQEEFQLVAVDFLGHGQSSLGHGDDHANMESTVADVVAILDQLGIEKTHLVGYSMGGRVALAMTLTHPERVDRVVLESASPGIRDIEARRARQREDEERARLLETSGVQAFVDRWEKMRLFASQTSLPIAVQQRLRQSRLNNSVEGLAMSLRELGTGRQSSYWHQLTKCNRPLRLIVGALDEKFVSIAEAMAALVLGASLVIVEGSGHAVHLECPTAFGREVRNFLAES